MSKRNLETLVGLLVVLGLAALVFVALKAANLTSFSNGATYPLTASFDNIGGLKSRAPVRRRHHAEQAAGRADWRLPGGNRNGRSHGRPSQQDRSAGRVPSSTRPSGCPPIWRSTR